MTEKCRETIKGRDGKKERRRARGKEENREKFPFVSFPSFEREKVNEREEDRERERGRGIETERKNEREKEKTRGREGRDGKRGSEGEKGRKGRETIRTRKENRKQQTAKKIWPKERSEAVIKSRNPEERV